MLPSDSQRLFEQAFDTFKAFDDLTVASSSWQPEAFPTSIWQILQHLLVWQAHQLAQLQGTARAESFEEQRSWQAERVPASEAVLQAAVTQFKHQLVQLQTHVNQAREEASGLLAQAIILQEVALHLSFHLGEVVLMRRLQGTYPLPAHMAEFLQG
jgi:copper(I)-binding protein